MHTDPVCLVGSGGHALVVLDSLAALGWPAQSISLFDQSPERIGKLVGGHSVRAFDTMPGAGAVVHICIGDNQARAHVAAHLVQTGRSLLTIVDPQSIVSPGASIGEGSFVAPGAIIASGATIGECCIINHGAIVDHECALSDFVHIAPGATLAGAVSVGQGTLVGAGANILPRLSVASDSTIGAGAVLVEDAIDHATYVGVPAKRI